jgi:hypothetical protein
VSGHKAVPVRSPEIGSETTAATDVGFISRPFALVSGAMGCPPALPLLVTRSDNPADFWTILIDCEKSKLR